MEQLTDEDLLEAICITEKDLKKPHAVEDITYLLTMLGKYVAEKERRRAERGEIE